MEQHKKYGSDFVRIAHNHISINNPAAAAEIYGQRSRFLKSEFYDAFHQVRPVVFNTRNVQEHQRKRKYMNPAFSARALSKFEPCMDEEVCRWKLKILEMTAKPEPVIVDLGTWSKWYTILGSWAKYRKLELMNFTVANFLAFDVIGSFAFGTSFGFIEAGEDFCDLIRTIDVRGEVLNALGVLSPWMRPWMKYNFFDKFWSEGLRATSNLGKIGAESFARRNVFSEPREDLLSYLLAGKNDQAKEPLTDEEIIAESISFIVGGSDTTSSTMTNILDFIARDDAIQQRLVEEINTTFPGKMDADWVPPNSDLANMSFLNAVMREVMRVRPTSSTGLERVAPPGGKVIAGTFIPGGVGCTSS